MTALVVAAFGGCAAPDGLDSAAERFTVALSETRPFEPRLVDIGAPLPCAAPPPSAERAIALRDCPGLPAAGSDAFRRAAAAHRRLQRAIDAGPSSRGRRLRARARVVWEPRGDVLERSIADLESLVADRDRQATALSDLAALRLLRAAAGQDPRDLMAALEAANAARALDPHLPEARFNRALALERLALREEARRAWAEVAGTDPGAGWRRLGQARLDALSRPSPAAEWRQAGARRVRVHLFADGSSAAALQAAERFPVAARTLLETEGLGRWAAVAGTAEGEKMAAAHRHFHNAMLDYERLDLQRARPHLQAAEELLREAASPFADLAAFYGAVCELRSAPVSAERVLEHLAERLDPASAPILAAYVDWLRGHTYTTDADYDAGDTVCWAVNSPGSKNDCSEIGQYAEVVTHDRQHSAAQMTVSIGGKKALWLSPSSTIAVGNHPSGRGNDSHHFSGLYQLAQKPKTKDQLLPWLWEERSGAGPEKVGSSGCIPALLTQP